MKRYLAWKKSEPLCPAIACSPPPDSFPFCPQNPFLQTISSLASQPLHNTFGQQPLSSQLLTSKTDIASTDYLAAAAAAGAAAARLTSATAELSAGSTLASQAHSGAPSPFVRETKQLDTFLAAAIAASSKKLSLPLANNEQSSTIPQLTPPTSTLVHIGQQQQTDTKGQKINNTEEGNNAELMQYVCTSSSSASLPSAGCSVFSPNALSQTNSPPQQQQQIPSPLLSANNLAVVAAAVAQTVQSNAAAALLSSCGQSPQCSQLLQHSPAATLLAATQQQLTSAPTPTGSSSHFYSSPQSNLQPATPTNSFLAQNNPSAFQLVQANLAAAQQQQQQAQLQQQHQQSPNMSSSLAAAAMYPELMSCFPGLLDRLGPHILRSHISNTQFKPIPNNERVDLLRFRVKEPQEWGADDVVAWMLDVARRHQIPCENLNMHKFAKCTGPLLMLMTEQNFRECDPCYGSLLFSEFRKLLPEDTVIDDWIRSCKTTNNNSGLEEEPSRNEVDRFPPSPEGQPANPINGLLAAAVAAAANRPQQLGGLLGEMNTQMAHLQQQQNALQLPLSQRTQMSLPRCNTNTAAACQQLLNNSAPILGPTFGSAMQQQQKMQHSSTPLKRVGFDNKASTSANNDSSYQNSSNLRLKIRKNKDGRPRKRSQHTKGNKLWEFIRDALKDTSTCPSVVRWEDPAEGVFRIVESEKLARLWGDKKNNQKMTYEKLSRAMRTYYEKQILVPVPKTGLYPKKLVYKFGPSAHGWSAPPHLVMASNSLIMEQL